MAAPIKETWYTLRYSAIVVERYDDGGVTFTAVRWNGDREPFSDIKALEEEGEIVTKAEAEAHLAEVRKMIEEASRKSASPSP